MSSNSDPRDDYERVHSRRFKLSHEWLSPLLVQGVKILELGGLSVFGKSLTEEGLDVAYSTTDLRYPRNDSDDHWDLVLCMEVLEHIADQDSLGISDAWKGDGALTMLKEAFRVLKPGGCLFLTTPNAASITAIKHALHHSPPAIWRPHVREYVPYELDELVRLAGFAIERRETLDVWLNAISPEERERLVNVLAVHRYPGELRGEDIFVLARKPILQTPKAPVEGEVSGKIFQQV